MAATSLAAGSASAQIELGLSGYMQQWVGYANQDSVNGGDWDGTNTASDTEVHFDGSFTVDNGITIGVRVELEGNTSSDQIDASYLFIDGSFGRIEMGKEDSAQYKMQYAAPEVGIGLNSGDQTNWVTFDGIGGTSGVFLQPFGSTFVEVGSQDKARKVTYYTPRFAGFQVGASYAPTSESNSNGPFDRDQGIHDSFSFGANYVETFDSFDVAVSGGYGLAQNSDDGADDPSVWNLGLNVGFANFVFGGSYAQGKDDPFAGDNTGWDLGVSYGTGPWSVSLAWYHGERDGDGGTLLEADLDSYQFSGRYTLGPGIDLAGTLGFTNLDPQDGGEDNKAWYLVVGPNLEF